MIELVLIGAFVGLLSGFFGIGGGTILVPLLLLAGFETKTAIGISIVQMVFSSVYGSYLNNKKGSLDISMVLIIGLGGFVGAFFSGFVAALIPSRVLEIIFFSFVLFALSRMFFKTKEHKDEKRVSKSILFPIGMIIGLFSMLIGVGGSIMLVPILVGFLHVELKKATSAGLFFVMFSSVSGLISHTINGHIDFSSGIVIGLASLFGVYLGIHLKHSVSNEISKKLLMLFYLAVISYLAYRIFVL
jgi:uncharacterized membrane protein YfcA